MSGGDLPALRLNSDAVDRNIAAMSAYCAGAKASLAPHAKTHMSLDLLQRQLDAGAWGFTAATPAQVRQLAEWGMPRILHANLAVDPGFIEWVGRALLREGAPEYLCYVDSVDAVRLLERHLGAPARPLPVLLERGFAGGRTGARSDEAALETARAVAASPHLRLTGVAAFEGLAPRRADEPSGTVPAAVDDLLRDVHRLVDSLRAADLLGSDPIVSAGGSSYFDRVVAALGPDTWQEPTTLVLRSGCYLTHDHGMYADSTPRVRDVDGPGFEAAFRLHARVLSRPEPTLAIVGFGRRDVPTDERMPLVLTEDGAIREDWHVFSVNDHHAFVRVPESASLRAGDEVAIGISHPCGAFDRHRVIDLVDDAGVRVGAVRPHL